MLLTINSDSLSEAKSNLKNTMMMGVVDRFDESMTVFEQELRQYFSFFNTYYVIKNVNQQPLPLKEKIKKVESLLLPEILERLYQANRLDLELYEFANTLLKGIDQSFRRGRNVYEGYQRGWGLQFGRLREKVLNDTLYQEAFEVAKGRTLVSEFNRMNIFLIMKFFIDKIPFGHIVEYGSYKGGNAIFMAYVASKMYPDMKVYALDSFEGMPETDKAVDAHNKGNFSDVNFNTLQETIA